MKEADKALAFFKEEFGFDFKDVTDEEKLGEIFHVLWSFTCFMIYYLILCNSLIGCLTKDQEVTDIWSVWELPKRDLLG